MPINPLCNDFINPLKIHSNLSDGNVLNTGDKTVILASSSPGYGGEFSIGEHMYCKYVSQYFKTSTKIHDTFCMNPNNISIKLQATADDLFDVLLDRSVENIILVGHSSYDTWASRSILVDSYDVATYATDHLKKGFFINAGCALIDSDTFFPLGSFCMKNWQNLLGARKGRKMGFDDIKKHKFHKQPVYIHEYLTYYEMMWDDINDYINEQKLQMKIVNNYRKKLAIGVAKN